MSNAELGEMDRNHSLVDQCFYFLRNVSMNHAIRGIRSRILTDKSSLSIKVLHPFLNFTLYCVLCSEN